MSNIRNLVFANNEYYHVYNRGIDRRPTYINPREYKRALDLLSFYQYAVIPLRYSHYIDLPQDLQSRHFETMQSNGKIVEVLSYCLMPNHFHLLIKQKEEKGIATYVGNFINAYTKYFNTKHKRTGPLFQGVFRAVNIETDEQLLHLTRYIHLNPVASNVITSQQLSHYPWTSFPIYSGKASSDLVENKTVSDIKKMIPAYEQFVMDQVSYAKELEKIKHLRLEYERV